MLVVSLEGWGLVVRSDPDLQAHDWLPHRPSCSNNIISDASGQDTRLATIRSRRLHDKCSATNPPLEGAITSRSPELVPTCLQGWLSP
jgi:hypothetical protein